MIHICRTNLGRGAQVGRARALVAHPGRRAHIIAKLQHNLAEAGPGTPPGSEPFRHGTQSRSASGTVANARKPRPQDRQLPAQTCRRRPGHAAKTTKALGMAHKVGWTRARAHGRTTVHAAWPASSARLRKKSPAMQPSNLHGGAAPLRAQRPLCRACLHPLRDLNPQSSA